MLHAIVLLSLTLAIVRSDDYKQLRIPDFPEPLQDLVTKEVAGFYRDLTAEQWNMIWKLHDDYVDIGRLMQALQKADKVLFDKMSPIVQSLAPKIQAMPLEAQMYVFRSANDLLIDIVRVNGKKPEENQLKAFGWLVVNRFDHLQDDSKKALRQAVPDYVQVVEGEKFRNWAKDPYA
ncbi:Fatty-acid and retinol-binding protein 1 [Aphelenchoides avenae]|nr:Fatty-acid and retinol-binding protein 1 [Aphelenchus avenae]